MPLPPLDDKLRNLLRNNVNSATYRQYIINYHIAGEMKFPDDYDQTRIDPAVLASIKDEIDKLVNQPNPEEIADWNSVSANPTAENLKAYIAKWEKNPPYGNHVEEARKRLAELLYKPILAEWERIKALDLSTYDRLKSKREEVVRFIDRYKTAAPELAVQAAEYLKELEKQGVEFEWKELAGMPLFSLQEVRKAISDVQSFISRYSSAYPALSDTARNYLDELHKREKEFLDEEAREKCRQQWVVIDKSSFNAVATYIKTHPDSPFKEEADNILWSLSTVEPIRKRSVENYLRVLPYGVHYPEAQELLSLMTTLANGDPDKEEMLVIEDADIFDLKEWLDSNVDSMLYPMVDSMFDKRKDVELAKIRQNPAAYSDLNALELLKRGIFDKGELFHYGFANEWSLKKMEERQNFEMNHPLPTPKGKYDDVEGEVTDVFLFGVPSAGKTCVLTGLICSPKSQFATIQGDGDYVELLSDYCSEASAVPARTEGGFVAVCQGKIKDSDNEWHQINVIDMAGEDFAIKIANNQAGTTTFADMGHGASKLLASDHRKVVFIIIDPTMEKQKFSRQEPVLDSYGNTKLNPDGDPETQEVKYEVSQINTLSRLVQLFSLEKRNKSICDNLNSIHFVVTKSDTLGDVTNMESLVRDRTKIYETNVFEMIKDLCAPENLNIPNPRIFPFSLGQFYVGGIYSYNPADSNLLIDAICCASSKVRKNKFVDGLVNFLNYPLF